MPAVLWAYRTTYKVTTGHTLFQLMHGQEAVVSAEYIVPNLRIAVDNRLGDEESLKVHLVNLTKLDECRVMAQWVTKVAQHRRKYWHNRCLRWTNFRPGQLVLKYNGRNELQPGKFKIRGLGPYKIREVGKNGVVKLSTLDHNPIRYLVNDSKLKLYRERDKPVGRHRYVGLCNKGGLDHWTKSGDRRRPCGCHETLQTGRRLC